MATEVPRKKIEKSLAEIPTADLIPDNFDKLPPKPLVVAAKERNSIEPAENLEIDLDGEPELTSSASELLLHPEASTPTTPPPLGPSPSSLGLSVHEVAAKRERTPPRTVPVKSSTAFHAVVAFILFWAVVLSLVGGWYTGNKLVLYIAIVCTVAIVFSSLIFQTFLNFLGNAWTPTPFTRFALNAGPCAALLVAAACYFSPTATGRIWIVGERTTVRGGYLLAVPFLQDIRSIGMTHEIDVPFVQMTEDKHVMVGVARTVVRVSSVTAAVSKLVQDYPDPDEYLDAAMALHVIQEVESQVGASTALELQAITALDASDPAPDAGVGEMISPRHAIEWNRRIELDMRSSLPVRPPKKSLGFLEKLF